MVVKQTSFELAPDVLIPETGVAGNGDAFDVGFTGTGTSFETRNGEPPAIAHGSVYGVIFTGTTAASNYRGWNITGSNIHTRQSLYLDVLPTAAMDVVQVMSGTTQLARVRIRPDGKLSVVVGATASATVTTSPIPTPDVLVRMECSFGFAAGTFTLDLYQGSSTTPIAGTSLNLTGLTWPATSATQVRMGVLTSHANLRLRTDIWGVSDTGRLGPYGSTTSNPTPPTEPTDPGTGGGTGVLLGRLNGVPTSTSAPLRVRTSGTTSVRIKVGTDSAVTQNVTYTSAQIPNAQGLTSHSLTNLDPYTDYYYRVEMNGTLDTAAVVGRIRTAPTPGTPTSFAFNASSCCDQADSPALGAIADREDDLFFHLGDMYYADGSGTNVDNIRTQIVNRLQAPNHHRAFATTAMDYGPSDHDAARNNTNAGEDPTGWANWNTVYREQFPGSRVQGNGTIGCYHTFVWGRVRFIKIDRRSFATSRTATDNASKTCLGAVQKQWLKDTITAATEPVIVIVQADPWKGAAEVGDDGWFGFTTERTELANFFTASGKNIAMLAGDMHALAADTSAPGGVFLMHCSPLNNDPSIKGGPYQTGTYPTAETAPFVQQYGHIDVTDSGSSVILKWTGYSANGTQRLTLSKTYSAPNVNAPPTVGTGPDETDVEPFTTVQLVGTDADPNGTIASRLWTQISGPSVTINNATQKIANFVAPGTLDGTTLAFRYTVRDNAGATAFAEITIGVLDTPERILRNGVWVAARMTRIGV